MRLQSSFVAVATTVTSALLIVSPNDQYLSGHLPGADRFNQLRASIRTLPLNETLFCSLHNALTSVQTLASAGNSLAARWHMVKMLRQLRSFRNTWAACQFASLRLLRARAPSAT